MSTKSERIQYLTAKAQRKAITADERNELARLLGKKPEAFESENGLNTLVGIALLAIAISIISEMVSKK